MQTRQARSHHTPRDQAPVRTPRRPSTAGVLDVPTSGRPTAASLLWLQTTAGNRAVATSLQRYLEKPGATASEVPRTTKGRPQEGWVENDQDPVGVYLRREGDAWFQWSQRARTWNPTTAPPGASEQPASTRVGTEPTTTSETSPGGTSTARPPVPPNRNYPPGKRVLTTLEGTSGMSLGGSAQEPIALPGGDLPDKFVEMLFGQLDSRALLALRAVNRWFREHGSTALRDYLQGRVGRTVSGRSALDPRVSLAAQYLDTIAPRSLSQLIVVADKVSSQTIGTLTAGLPAQALSLLYAENTGKQPIGGRQVAGPYDHGEEGARNSKMHNKFLVGRGARVKPFLLSGSPNLTPSAMTANIESAVVVRYPGIAKLYSDYAALIARRSRRDTAFTAALEDFNRRDVLGIRAALAPFVDVGTTLQTELRGADQVTMRMFLVGSGEKHDVVASLCTLATQGAAVEVIVDRQQAATTGYVRQALRRLQHSGVRVASERGKERPVPQGQPKEYGIMHDQLVMAHYPKTGESKERWTVMIGSSGLTRNVDQNWNYENLLIIDDKALFDWFQLHHRTAEPYRGAGIPARDPASELGRATVLLDQLRAREDDGWVTAAEAVAALRTGGLDPSLLDQAVAELGMKSTWYKGKTWFG